MKIYVNDASSNMLAVLRTKVVPRMGEMLFLKSSNKMVMVKDVIHQYCDEDNFESITLYVMDEDQSSTENYEMPEWLQRAY